MLGCGFLWTAIRLLPAVCPESQNTPWASRNRHGRRPAGRPEPCHFLLAEWQHTIGRRAALAAESLNGSAAQPALPFASGSWR